jgi:hypothetical protein
MKEIKTRKTTETITYKCEYCDNEFGYENYAEQHEKQNHLCKHENLKYSLVAETRYGEDYIYYAIRKDCGGCKLRFGEKDVDENILEAIPQDVLKARFGD